MMPTRNYTTVLLVDDDVKALRGLTRVLRGQPYHLHTARSADEAIHTLKVRHVDVIVTDEKMPGMSGTELLAWVAEDYPQVMRILLTGHASTETAIRAINEGEVCQFLTKPCDGSTLAVAIRKALDQKELLSSSPFLRLDDS